MPICCHMREKYVRGNNAPFMNKIISQAFMQRSKLKNKYNKFPTVEKNLSTNNKETIVINLLQRLRKVTTITFIQISSKITKNSGKASDHFYRINKKTMKKKSY